jgi:hypothetical protein
VELPHPGEGLVETEARTGHAARNDTRQGRMVSAWAVLKEAGDPRSDDGDGPSRGGSVESGDGRHVLRL